MNENIGLYLNMLKGYLNIEYYRNYFEDIIEVKE